MKREDIDLERGDEEIVFVEFGEDIETSEMLENKEEPREELKEMMKSEGLEWENARIAAIFGDEFSLHLEDKAEMKFRGEKLHP